MSGALGERSCGPARVGKKYFVERRRQVTACELESKHCCGCDTVKPASDYYRYGHGRLYHRCKGCISIYNREQNERHVDKRRAYGAAYRRINGSGWERGREKYEPTEREKHDGYLRRTYGIDIDDYEMMLARQNGTCAICLTDCNRSTTKRLCVDRDHDTGTVRGLLCFQCNVGLGKFKDDPALLQAAIQYIGEKT